MEGFCGETLSRGIASLKGCLQSPHARRPATNQCAPKHFSSSLLTAGVTGRGVVHFKFSTGGKRTAAGAIPLSPLHLLRDTIPSAAGGELGIAGIVQRERGCGGWWDVSLLSVAVAHRLRTFCHWSHVDVCTHVKSSNSELRLLGDVGTVCGDSMIDSGAHVPLRVHVPIFPQNTRCKPPLW